MPSSAAGTHSLISARRTYSPPADVRTVTYYSVFLSPVADGLSSFKRSLGSEVAVGTNAFAIPDGTALSEDLSYDGPTYLLVYTGSYGCATPS